MHRVEHLSVWDASHSRAPATGRDLQFSPILLVIYVAVMMTYGFIHFTHQTHLTALLTVLTVVLMFCTSFVHMVETRGLRRAVLMAASAFTITLAAEWVGVATGALFGHYSYSDQLGVKVFDLVPLVIPIAWLMMLYPAFETAALLLRRRRPHVQSPRSLRTLAENGLLAVTAAAAMTAWDLSLDPRMVSDGNWAWRDVGQYAYFGIPLSNFAGWLVTAFAIYLVWLWIMRAHAHARAQPRLRRMNAMVERLANAPGALGMTRHLSRPLRSPVWSALPVVIYIITWLGESIVNVVLWNTPLVGLAVFVGMGVFSVPALARLWRDHGDALLTVGQLLRDLVIRDRTITRNL